MAREVTICYIKQFFQFVVAYVFIYHQCTHNAKPYPAVEYFIEI
jgi:hypothetical protein